MEPSWGRLGCHLGATLGPSWELAWSQFGSHLGSPQGSVRRGTPRIAYKCLRKACFGTPRSVRLCGRPSCRFGTAVMEPSWRLSWSHLGSHHGAVSELFLSLIKCRDCVFLVFLHIHGIPANAWPVAWVPASLKSTISKLFFVAASFIPRKWYWPVTLGRLRGCPQA